MIVGPAGVGTVAKMLLFFSLVLSFLNECFERRLDGDQAPFEPYRMTISP